MTDNTPPTPVSDDPSVAFEKLRSEVAFGRAAVEGLTAARERLPDYSPTLSEMSGALRDIVKRVGNIEGNPAMGLTPARLAAEISEAGQTTRAADQRLLHEALSGFAHSTGQLAMLVQHGRSAIDQQRALLVTGVAAFAFGLFLMTFLPGSIARSLPASWHVPEWMAARAVGTDPKTAAERLLAASHEAPTAAVGDPISSTTPDNRRGRRAR